MTIKERAKRVKMLMLDIDGVLTDGRIIYDDNGNELKCFYALDGMGLALLKHTSIWVALISSKGSPAVLRRVRDFGAQEVKLNINNKLKVFDQILWKYKLKPAQICFIGDDLVDLPLLKRAGFSVAVPGACKEAKKLADYICKKEGGKGAVREVIEIILRGQNIWSKVVKKYYE